MHTNYVISLTSASTRREHIKNEFGRQNIPFEFFDALVPSLSLDNAINEHLPNLAQASLSTGEKACFMSHYMLWQKCLNENLPYIFIFEDDILLGESAREFLNEEQWLEERFKSENFIIKLETFLQPIRWEDSNIQPHESRSFKLLKSFHYGTAGYIISQQAIKELINKLKQYETANLVAIDLLIFNIDTENIYQITPAICIQDTSNIESSLQQDRELLQRQNKKTKSIREKIIHVLTKYKRLKEKKERIKHIIPFK
ncbi:lacto-N-neotetraose biosynthesis glycosyltransferase LgtB [Pasteurella canis]|uniref:glycosyltransferase family 25 protein n=1 Tax=Pasteurella canis TaxID=753 RepID=UPI001D11138D|nr:glycosyltransferase family 25 protein [Pasteurella canis]UDW84191.1 glycosyltransferase family 25 protein [Pasteurella canis]GJJ80588.1 lacto-N-neotetraose biosynthesis glycosyltransferase LgtB [Pasteurella canis]